MTRAFIVRPFGTKEGIDFDRVEKELIGPALTACNIEGRTTGEISRQGNIREDMFRLLVISDIVIADVSIHNANVFYELGIRHGLQERHTFMIRAEASPDKYPFDLQTDRYFLYDPNNPGSKLNEFIKALKSTLAASGKDSPVFQLLPKLRPHDRQVLTATPQDFQEEVERAKQKESRGDLRLLADEARGFEWGTAGLRIVGDAQFEIKAFAGAKETFEALRSTEPYDFHVNYRLGTIYQKLSQRPVAVEQKIDYVARSEQAIRRVLDLSKSAESNLSPAGKMERSFVRAEGHALLGSNAKTRWLEKWQPLMGEEKRSRALRSPHLGDSVQHYLAAFAENLDSYYAGINALAMLKVQWELAKALPDTWLEGFDDKKQAKDDLKERELRMSRIAATLHLASGTDEALRKDGGPDPWRDISQADLCFLTSEKPRQVGSAYRRVLSNASPMQIESTRRNILLFRELELLTPNVDAALKEFPPPTTENQPQRVVLFTGHMLDVPERPRPRFPATAAAETTARMTIEDALRNEMNEVGGVSLGIAGGSCGSDIIFHEACKSLGIATQLYLALPPELFQVKSVNRGGPRWVERYRKLCHNVAPRILADSLDLPNWLADKHNYNIWERNNLWMMFNALAMDAKHLTLVALCNREQDPDGPGGTRHLIGEASKWDFKIIELDARELLKPNQMARKTEAALV